MAGRPPRPNPHSYNQLNHSQSPRISLNPDTLLVIKLPDPRFLLVLSRSLFLATLIITFPCIRSFLKGPSASSAAELHRSSGSFSSEYWNLLWRDFAEEGLFKRGQKALVLNSAIEGFDVDVVDDDEGSMFMNNDGISVVFEPDFGSHSSLPKEGFDFVFVWGLSIRSYQKQSDYRIVYLKKFRSTIVAMKKLGPKNHSFDSSAKRKLCDMTMEAKKAALRGLEDALYEPPRKRAAYSKKINFLPDLLGDSLEHYPRRVFIDVGSNDVDDKNNIAMKWFEKNYPKRNQEFEVYGSETVSDRIDVPDWLTKNVGAEDYVVMKAEAEVVEKMIERKVMGLVDELFFECRNQWQDQVKNKMKKNRKNHKSKKSKRAYWECLALYGKLRDEGVAVHQWWE
ncbi:FK506-binding protein 12 [Hibiscus syriacus]|uniref:FK506-binding protein 12 n=1 Tax=Hibiscus syriacus TaxID=106335 RepID=A0A6A2Y7V1_HIBSY|nr:FK506-binding protein 12 [Hibiscus syriacus]